MAYLTIPDAIHSGQLRKANTNNHNRFDDRATVFTIRTATQYTERWFPEGPRRFAPVLVIWDRAQPRQSAALENSTSGEFYITWGVPAQKTKSVWRVGKAGLGLKGSATTFSPFQKPISHAFSATESLRGIHISAPSSDCLNVPPWYTPS